MPNWGHVLSEIQKERDDPGGDSAPDKVRQRYLQQLHNRTERNIICYYSGWLSKPRNLEGLDINDEDTNGFMLCTHGIDRSKGLDLFLHTPGGSGAATESIVHYLKKMFGNDIRAFVPQMAMSAGTIIACACKEIFMGHHPNLGPVDPQVNGLHAYAAIEQLLKAYQEIVADNQRAWVWNPMLSNYTPGFVQQCDWAIKKVKDLVENYLKDNMFAGRQDAQQLATGIVTWLTDLSKDKGHDHHIYFDECHQRGLEVRPLEDAKDRTLQDLVLTIHHCFMFTLSNTGCFKIIENHVGRRWLKVQMNQIVIQQPIIGFPGVAPAVSPKP
jgi:ATP-dependent protease ClpP protease subunit